MLADNFKIAMYNTIAMASYDRPDLTNPPGSEWLIVERSGADGEFLTISDAGYVGDPPPASAPAGIVENNSMCGVLLHEDESGEDAVFLLVRHLPPGGSVPGSFFPADGYARMSHTCAGVLLRAAGRHAHDSSGDDIPNPGPGEGFSWHFDAEKVSWAGEEYPTVFTRWPCWWRFLFPWPWCWRHFFRRPVLIERGLPFDPDIFSPAEFRAQSGRRSGGGAGGNE